MSKNIGSPHTSGSPAGGNPAAKPQSRASKRRDPSIPLPKPERLTPQEIENLRRDKQELARWVMEQIKAGN